MIQFVPRSKHTQSRLHRKKVAVCFEISTKYISALCGQKVEFLTVKPGGIYSNHGALKYYGTRFDNRPRHRLT